MSRFSPSLHVREIEGGVRLEARGITYGEGPTLQEAADELVRKVLAIAMRMRSGSIVPVGTELRIDPALHRFIWDLATVALTGGDIRSLLLG